MCGHRGFLFTYMLQNNVTNILDDRPLLLVPDLEIHEESGIDVDDALQITEDVLKVCLGELRGPYQLPEGGNEALHTKQTNMKKRGGERRKSHSPE